MGLRIELGGVLVALAPCSYALALLPRDENALAPVLNFVLLPLQLLSGVFLPLALAPLWLRSVAPFNPLAYTVDAARRLFSGVIDAPAALRALVTVAALVRRQPRAGRTRHRSSYERSSQPRPLR